MAARDRGRSEEALPGLRQAIAAWPQDARLWQTLGVLHRSLEQSAEAAAAFTEAARLSPLDRKAAHGVAQASLEAGRPAVALFEQACRLAPQDGSVLLGQAAARMAEGDPLGAIAELAGLVAANPLWLDGHNILARLRWSFQQERFTASFEEALRSAPQGMPLWTAYLNLLIHAECYVQAAEVIGRARAALSAPDIFLAQEAICASELGEAGRADALFDRIDGAGDIIVAERRLRHLLRTGRPEEAVRRAEPLLSLPDSNHVWPYVSAAWRLTDDPRREWLERDGALIATYGLDVAQLVEPLAALLRSLHVGLRPLGQSVRGGTQTDGPLLAREEPEIRELRRVIRDAVSTYIAALPAQDPAHPTLRHGRSRFRFAGSWSVRLLERGHHSNHVHPMGWISSAFYVVTPGAGDAGGLLQFGVPPEELGLALGPVATVEPKPGRLVLFPSNTWHGTAAFGAGERMTVAFDIAALD